MLSEKIFTCFSDNCGAKSFRGNLTARSSNSLMGLDCSSVVQRPWVGTLLHTAPQPFLEASHEISMSIFPSEIGLLDSKTLSAHQIKSAFAAGDKHIVV